MEKKNDTTKKDYYHYKHQVELYKQDLDELRSKYYMALSEIEVLKRTEKELKAEIQQLKEPHRNYKGRQTKYQKFDKEWYKLSQDGMTYREISKQYGCSLDTVHTVLKRAGLNKRAK